jgi:hypothetical protein
VTKKSIPTEQTRANIDRVSAILSDSPGWIERLSQDLTDEQLCAPLNDGERSFIETLAHLINSEARTSEAIYLALLVDEPQLVPVHSERQWGKLLRFDLLSYAELLAYFKTRRAVLLQVLAGLDDDQWARAVREAGKQRQESVYWKARALALHELEHLTDLEAKLS